MALIVIFIVPIVGITLFWIVHVLPEKIAHKRHHPQRDAIHMLCLLSLVFGGLLWPLAFLWAYSKPVLHKLAYGTDKHEDYYKEQGNVPAEGAALPTAGAGLRTPAQPCRPTWPRCAATSNACSQPAEHRRS